MESWLVFVHRGVVEAPLPPKKCVFFCFGVVVFLNLKCSKQKIIPMEYDGLELIFSAQDPNGFLVFQKTRRPAIFRGQKKMKKGIAIFGG